MTPCPLAELRDLMDDERTALRTGNITELSEITSRLERILARIGDAPDALDNVEIGVLRHRAQENLSLLEASRDGVQNVRRRLAEVRNLSEGLQTYGCDGKRRALRGTGPQEDRSA